MGKGIKRIISAALAITFALTAVTLSACNGEPQGTGYTVTFMGAAEKFYETRVESGRRVARPKNFPERSGYAFKGWDFDFDKPIYADAVIYPKWAFFQNRSLDFDNPDGFICSFLATSEAGGEPQVRLNQTLQRNVLAFDTQTPTGQAAVKLDFHGTILPAGCKIIINARCVYRDPEVNAGAILEFNGEQTINGKLTRIGSEFSETVIRIDTETEMNDLSFRPASSKSAVSLEIAALEVLTDFTDVDFSENPQYLKAFRTEYEEKETTDDPLYIETDEDTGKDVLVYIARPRGSNRRFVVLDYGGLNVPAGTEIEMRFAFETTSTRGGLVVIALNDLKGNYLNLNYDASGGYHTYRFAVNEQTLDTVAIKTSDPSAFYTIKIEYVKVIYGSQN